MTNVFKSQATVPSLKITIFVLLAAFLVFHQTDAWRRRRRRRQCTCQVSLWSSWSGCSTEKCGQQGSQRRTRTVSSCGGAGCPALDETRQCFGSKAVNCQVSSWSPWNSCSAEQCGQQGSQRRTRTVVSSSSCGGAGCPALDETRQCFGSKAVNCQVNSWSEWSACTTPCGVSGVRFSARHRVITERCGGNCTSTFRKTRACLQLSCLNGGSLKGITCFCKEGYSGDCCESSTFRQKTPACLELSCLNGGNLKEGTCFCKEGYSGNCCEKGKCS